MKALIFDSGVLINLSMNGLLYLVEDMKKVFEGKFLITEDVKFEVVDRPMKIQRFELGALRILNLLDSGILEMPASLGINEKELKRQTSQLMEKANHTMQIKGEWVHLVEAAEMSCVALSDELRMNGIASLIVIDERTTRMLFENPAGLERVMSEKLHQQVKLRPDVAMQVNEYSFIRSTELVYVAYKKKLIRLSGKKVLEAALYATKYKGSAVSFEEIEVLKRM